MEDFDRATLGFLLGSLQIFKNARQRIDLYIFNAV